MANDVCLALDIRQSDVSKTIGKFTPSEKVGFFLFLLISFQRSMRVACETKQRRTREVPLIVLSRYGLLVNDCLFVFALTFIHPLSVRDYCTEGPDSILTEDLNALESYCLVRLTGSVIPTW